MVYKFLVLTFLCCYVCVGRAGELTEKADSCYKHEDFKEAIGFYEEAVLKEGVSAGLLYNLGNSYYRLGDNGKAMLYFERAKKLQPGNKNINHNLEFLRSKILEANRGSSQNNDVNIEPDQPNFLNSLYNLIAIDSFSNNWAVFAVMAFILFLGSLALYTFTPNVLARKTGFFSGLTFLIFSLIFIIFALISAHQYSRTDEVILMEFTAPLLDQPNEKANSASSILNKGTKLQILESKKSEDGTDWLKVKLNSDNIGWIKKNSVEAI